jgi:glycosyltransferase involved in cell wall biosynthesis
MISNYDIKESLVSVCIPLYNGELYLKECIESALAQTYSKIEIILIDDCSYDTSPEIAAEFARRDYRVKLYRNSNNLGLVANWNKAALHANGEWIKFLFQDDLLETNCIESMLAAASDDTFMVICGRKLIFEDCDSSMADYFNSYVQRFDAGKILGNSGYISPEFFCEAILNNFLENFLGEPTSVMIRKDAFARFNLFNTNLVQLCDLEYWLRVGTNVGFVYVSDTLARFRIHGSSATATNQKLKEFRKNHLDQFICYYELATNPLFEKLRRAACAHVPKVDYEMIVKNKYSNILKLLAEKKEDCERSRGELQFLLSQYPLMKKMVKSASGLRSLFAK